MNNIKLFRPSDLNALLVQHKKHMTKSLSQNFLIDGNIINKIIAVASVTSDDFILEIGPGAGALTQSLLKQNATVLAIEKDHNFADLLNKLFAEEERLKVYCDDILSFPIKETLAPYLKKHRKKAKVVANLPYHLTSPILGLLLPLHDIFSSLTIMIQKEVAERITANLESKSYSGFTVFNQLYSDPQYMFTISPNCFQPKPKVHSAVLHMTLKPPPLLSSLQGFIALVKKAFNQRRKMLSNSLSDYSDAHTIKSLLTTFGLNASARAEDLSLQDFIKVFEALFTLNNLGSSSLASE